MSLNASIGPALDSWRMSRWPKSIWRVGARKAMQDAVEAIGIMDPALLARRDEILTRVDAAYPFGERKYEPYKCWLKERRLLIAALDGPRTAPSADEAGVCEVAGDLVELGRIDEARKLLDEQAPNRLARKCPACGAWPGGMCKTMPADGEKRCECPSFASSDDIAAAPQAGHACDGCGASSKHLLVPHHARLVGHLDAGPLFTGARP